MHTLPELLLCTCTRIDLSNIHWVCPSWEIFSKLDFKETWGRLMRCSSELQVCSRTSGREMVYRHRCEALFRSCLGSPPRWAVQVPCGTGYEGGKNRRACFVSAMCWIHTPEKTSCLEGSMARSCIETTNDEWVAPDLWLVYKPIIFKNWATLLKSANRELKWCWKSISPDVTDLIASVKEFYEIVFSLRQEQGQNGVMSVILALIKKLKPFKFKILVS